MSQALSKPRSRSTLAYATPVFEQVPNAEIESSNCYASRKQPVPTQDQAVKDQTSQPVRLSIATPLIDMSALSLKESRDIYLNCFDKERKLLEEQLLTTKSQLVRLESAHLKYKKDRKKLKSKVHGLRSELKTARQEAKTQQEQQSEMM
jgi:hypothetical protein